MSCCDLTIFTPTFNRAYCLGECYTSLKMQRPINFIWQIIDDGSTDGTEDLVKSFIDEKILYIQYYKQKNSGKAAAMNRSFELTTTQFWLCLDSDDILVEGAVAYICEKVKEISEEDEVCGLIGVRSNHKLEPMSYKPMPKGIEIATQYEIRYKFKIPPEYVQIYKTKVLQAYPFDLHQDEKYMPLSYAQNKIDLRYKLKIIHKPLMISEYLSDGLTRNHRKQLVNNPHNFLRYYSQMLSLNTHYWLKIIIAIKYNAVHRLALPDPDEKSTSVWVSFTKPLGFLYYQMKLKNLLVK